MNNEKEKIKQFCENIFFKNGFTKISMDELATGMKISKKTIYKHFDSKEQLILEVINHMLENVKSYVKTVIEKDENSVAKFMDIVNFISNTMFKPNEKFFKDIQSDFPEVWLRIDKFRSELMPVFIKRIFQQGIEEGLMVERPWEILITMLVASVRSVVNPDFILRNNYSISEALSITLDILMDTILTSKGKLVYKKIKLEFNNEN